MTDLLTLSVSNDSTLNQVFDGKPYLTNIEGSINICMTLCGQDIDGCNDIEFVNMKNAERVLILTPNPKNTNKCNIKLAFDSSSDSTNANGSGSYKLENIFVTVPSLHKINNQIFDMESFIVYSSVQKNGTKLFVCMCSFYVMADSVNNNDWRLTSYTLMNELFGDTLKIPNVGETMAIGSPPNPIDVNSFMPNEGFRNFYEYSHPNNTKVNFRIFQTPLFVSSNVLNNLKQKLTPGIMYTNFKDMIQTYTNPPSGIFLFFSQDVTKSIDSALGGSSSTNNCSISNIIQDLKDTVKTKVSTTSKKKKKKKKKGGAKLGKKKKKTKKGKKTKKKKKKSKFTNMEESFENFENESDDEDEDEEEEFDNENEDEDEEEEFDNEDEDEEEEFDNEDEEDEDEEEEFDNDDEGEEEEFDNEDEEEDFDIEEYKSKGYEKNNFSIAFSILISIVITVIIYIIFKLNFDLIIFLFFAFAYGIFQIIRAGQVKKNDKLTFLPKNNDQYNYNVFLISGLISSLVLIALYRFEFFNKTDMKKNIMPSLFVLFIGVFVGLITYYSKRKPSKVTKSKGSKNIEERIENRKQYNQSKPIIIYTLIYFISLPICAYVLYSKIMNDPTFEGRGLSTPPQNKILEMLQNNNIQNLLGSKLRYYFILGLQILSTFILSLFLIISTRRSFNIRNGISLLIILFILAFVTVGNYMYNRSTLNSSNIDLCEFDFISPFSMNMDTPDLLKLFFGRNIDINLKGIDVNKPGFFDELNSNKEGDKNFVLQGGADIEAKVEVPGPKVADLETMLQGMMQSNTFTTDFRENMIYIFSRMSTIGYILIFFFFIVFIILGFLLCVYLVKNDNRTLGTKPLTVFVSLAIIIISCIWIVVGYIFYFIYKNFVKVMNTLSQLPSYVQTRINDIIQQIQSGLPTNSSLKNAPFTTLLSYLNVNPLTNMVNTINASPNYKLATFETNYLQGSSPKHELAAALSRIK
jgi:hypothetical protein